MTVACRVCSRVNPPEALFCYFDGVALDGQAGRRGPIAVGSQPFHSPFVFPSGKACRSFDELLLACDADWNEARDLLRQGYLEGFFGGLGRADLAASARQAARNPDPDLGLDQFLAKLPSGVREPARLVVQPLEINLGLLTRDANHRFVIHLENAGHGLLHGSVTAESSAWLSLGDGPGTRQKLFQTRHEASIPVQVIGKGLRAGHKPFEGRLVVESNGGMALIFVRAEVRVRPFPDGILAGAVTPRQIAEKAKAAPKEAAPLFVNGAVAAWYDSNGWTYPVQGPASSGLGAIQQFFEALGLVHPPKVEINETKVNLLGKPGEVLEHVIQVQAVEKRPVYAHASSTVPWLQVGRVKLDGRTARIPLRVPHVPSLPGERLRGEVHVVANGNQRFTVEVALAILGTQTSGTSAPPRPTAPVVLDYAQVRAHDGPAAVMVEPEPPRRRVTPPPPTPPPPVRTLALDDSRGAAEEAVLVTPEAPFTVEPMVEAVEVVPEAAPIVQNYRSAAPPPLPGPPMVAPLPANGVVDVLPLPETGRRGQAGYAAEDEEDFGPHRSKTLWHLAALGALLLALFGMALHDLLLPNDEDEDLDATPAAPIDWKPRLAIRFDDGADRFGPGVQTMRFGLDMLDEKDPENPGRFKRLTFDPHGKTNNTCLRIDGQEPLFGPSPAALRRMVPGIQAGAWVTGKRAEPLGKDSTGRQRDGLRSTWRFPSNIEVTQIVEIVPGEQSRKMDTCLIRYVLENKDANPHTVGIRFLLDTYIGANDGVPFIVPGASGLCDTYQSFPTPDKVPDYIQALEKPDLRNPGTVARLQFRLGNSLEAPERVTLGGWPDPDLARVGWRQAMGPATLWEVPVLPMNELQAQAPKFNKRAERDSAVAIYWSERSLGRNERREVGFTYGLGEIASTEGKLSLTVGGPMVKGSEFSLTAVVNEPKSGEKLTLTLPKKGLRLVGSTAEQTVPPVPTGATRPQSPVTWRLLAERAGLFRVRVQSSTGPVQELSLRIAPKARGVLD